MTVKKSKDNKYACLKCGKKQLQQVGEHNVKCQACDAYYRVTWTIKKKVSK